MMEVLNRLYGVLENKSDQYNVEFIKKNFGTIHSIVGGLNDSTSHAEQVSEMAIFTIQCAHQLAKKFQVKLSVRIGVHTGPATSIVTGSLANKNANYDVVGIVPSVAMDLLKESPMGSALISEDTFFYLPGHRQLDCKVGPMVHCSGKGLVKTWMYIEPRSEDPVQEPT
jgi:class 3 adenylate cyclase